MKVVIFGLGNFGLALALHLADSGNEVVVADKNPDRIDLIKGKVTHAVILDATNENAYRALPIKNTDLVVVAISENEGAAIITTAIVKKTFGDKAKIIARSSSSIQDTIFQAMGIDEIIHPEQEYAEQLTKKVNLKGTITNFEIDNEYLVSEVEVCKSIIGKTLVKSGFREEYDLNIITILRRKQYRNSLSRNAEKQVVIGMPKPDVKFMEKDILVVFGKKSKIHNYLKRNNADYFE